MSGLHCRTALAALAMTTAVSAGSVIHVDPDAPGAQDGSSWADAYHSLTAALAVAAPGDELRVAAGTYVPEGGVETYLRTYDLPAGVSLRGSFAGFGAPQPNAQSLASPTSLLDGDQLGDDVPFDIALNRFDNSHHVVTVGAGGAPTLIEGFAIRGGFARPATIDWRGGGVLALAADLTLRDCHVEDCAAMEAGGALYAGPGSSVELLRCSFEGCVVGDTGSSATGGAVSLHATAAVISECLFRDNVGRAPSFPSGVQGGALYLSDAVAGDGLVGRIERCLFEGNDSEIDGGAVTVSGECELVACDFVGNAVGPGLSPFGSASGGALSVSGRVDVIGCRFLGNESTTGGAGLGSALSLSVGDPLVAHCEFVGNGNTVDAAAAVSIFGSSGARIVGCTVAGNRRKAGGAGSAGLYVGSFSSDIEISQSILWGNDTDGSFDQAAQVWVAADVTPTFTANLVQGWDGSLGGSGNGGADPLLADLDGPDDVLGTLDDDPALLPGSPAIDAGQAGLIPADVVDLDCDGDLSEGLPQDIAGHVRRVDDPATVDAGSGAPVVDLGAREFGAGLPTDVWSDLGGGTSGAFGQPVLSGAGSFCPGQLIAIDLTGAPPGGLVLLLEALGSTPVPKYGGVIHPIPIYAQFLLVTGPGGSLHLEVPLIGALPPGLELYYQYLVHDTSLSPPIVLSNGQRAVVP